LLFEWLVHIFEGQKFIIEGTGSSALPTLITDKAFIISGYAPWHSS